MLTDNGAIRVESPYDKKMYLRINLKNIISSSVCFAIGTGGLVASIVYGAVSGVWDGFLIGGCAIIVALSVFLLTIVALSIKKGIALNKRAKADMFSEFMLVSEYSGDEKVSMEKVYYEKLFKCVETKDYFLAYINKMMVHPIYKSTLSKEEINTIRRLLSLEQTDDGEVPVASGKGVAVLSDEDNLKEIIISPNKKPAENAGEDGAE